MNYEVKPNYYLDSDWKDRTVEIENAFSPTLEDIKNDPEFYAELVNDLIFHWMYGTRETPMMNKVKRSQIARNFNFKIK